MPKADSVLSTPPLNTPIAGLDWLDIKDDASPAEIFRAIGRLRKEARDEIDRLIRFLDETENHMAIDCEPEDEGDDCDLEDDDPAEDEGTLEPSLGSLDHNHSQENWATGGRRDLEEDLAESGIADFEGLYEQVGTQDWQQGAMT